MNRRFGKTDFIVLAVVFAVLVFAVIFTAFKRKQGEFVVISLDGEVYREVPLEKDQEIEIKKEANTRPTKNREKKKGQCYYPFPHLCFKVAPCFSYRESPMLSFAFN